jgi:hypothetical protein
MRKADFATNHKEFDSWILWYMEMMQRLIDARRIVRTSFEKRELIEALVLRVSARWEMLAIRDIVTSLNRDSSQYAAALGLRLRRHLSHDECRAIFCGHRYVDFRSVGELRAFGKRYLVPRFDPFEAITIGTAAKIDEFITMRNLLAHYSDLGSRSYRGFMVRRYRYSRVPEPGTFLVTSGRDRQPRWATYMMAFIDASADMLQKVR